MAPPPTLPPNVQLDAQAIEANQTAQAEYDKYLQVQKTEQASKQRVTEAALEAQQAAAQITASANATREALAQQATRQALSEQATRQAQSVAVTATMQMAQATYAAESVHATQTAQSVEAPQTTEASRALATEQARNAQATETAVAQWLAATATTQAMNIAATATSQAQDHSATATTQAQHAQATEVAGHATATVIAAQALAAQQQADAERWWTSFWTAFKTIVAALVIVGSTLLIGFGALRLLDAGILHLRVIRDKTGVPFVVLEPDRHGRQTLLAPSRSPGPALTITPAQVQPVQIAAQAADAETTKRDQAVSLMLAATQGPASSASRKLADALGEEQIRMIEAPTTQLLPPEAQTAIDADWKVVSDA
jgi:hypothetical protein